MRERLTVQSESLIPTSQTQVSNLESDKSSLVESDLLCTEREVLQRSTMFIALSLKYVGAPAERNVLWRVQLHAAPDGAGYFYLVRAINILLLRSKDSNN